MTQNNNDIIRFTSLAEFQVKFVHKTIPHLFLSCKMTIVFIVRPIRMVKSKIFKTVSQRFIRRLIRCVLKNQSICYLHIIFKYRYCENNKQTFTFKACKRVFFPSISTMSLASISISLSKKKKMQPIKITSNKWKLDQRAHR